MENIMKKGIKLPHPFVILTFVIAVMSILTHFIPAGMYNRVVNDIGVKVVDPNTFQYIAGSPVTIIQFLTSIPRGFVEAGWIVAMTLFVGSGFAVVQKIGVIPAMIEGLARKFKGGSLAIVPILLFVFALIDSFIGTPELMVVYIPIIVPLMLRLGFDSITACAVVICGSAAGFSAALTNPFTIAIGQKLCGLPLYSGWEFRIGTFVITWLIGCCYVLHYARKILKNPEKSPMYQDDIVKRNKIIEQASKSNTDYSLNTRQKIGGLLALFLFVLMIAGIVLFKWDMPEMCAIFLLIGVGAGLIAGMNLDDLCQTLMEGCQDMMIGALVIGLSRSISVVMTDGQITDTIVHAISIFLVNLPTSIAVIGVLLAVTALNFVIPSGSGKAVVLFTILAPLADVLHISRQTMVLTYQFGDGFTKDLWPTSGYFMAAISLAGVPWQRWAKFYIPLVCIWFVSSFVMLLVAQAINLGPF
jgi:uncharacterized ion transporter superfamily protein YfcC